MLYMVQLDCEIGSRAALVLCPSCGRISRQILSEANAENEVSKLIRPHTCPVCSEVYVGCNPEYAQEWTSAYDSYKRNAYAYNQAVKDNLEKQWWYCEVSFTDPTQAYRYTFPYISDKGKIEPNTYVEVPDDDGGDRKIGIVTSCSLYNSKSVPYPVNQTKHIIRTVSKEEYDAANTPQPHITPPHAEEADRDIESRSVIPHQAPAAVCSDVENNSTNAIVTCAPAFHNPELERKIEYWKSQLLDTGKRNRMINYKDTKRSTLHILKPEATELFNKLAFSERPLTFQKPISKDSRVLQGVRGTRRAPLCLGCRPGHNP